LVVDLQLEDYERMAELVEIYADSPPGTLTPRSRPPPQRLNVIEIATLITGASAPCDLDMPTHSRSCRDR
jgi:hypothetical protein